MTDVCIATAKVKIDQVQGKISDSKKIGYFVPEFPGQTHIFLWREYNALKELGIDLDLISTKRPSLNIISHSWSKEAMGQTTYLFPLSLTDYLEAALEIFRSGFKAWRRCFASIFSSDDISVAERAGMFIWILIAGKLMVLARRKSWSHIHVESCSNAANIAMFSALLGGPSYSLSLLGPRLETYGSNQKQKWGNALFCLTMSELLLRDVHKKLAGFLPAHVEVAPVGVDLNVIKRNRPYQPWQGTGPCRIYACGRLNIIKGYQYLFEATNLLEQQGFDIKLKIAGEDEKGGQGYRKKVETLIQDLRLNNSVELLGSVSEERNRQGYEEAHVYVQASLDEGISVAIMEAMATEAPIVVTDVGGNSELVENGVNGILVPPGEPQAMADAIATLLRNPDFALTISQKARNKVVEKFHHRRSAEVLAKLLDLLHA